MEVTCLKNKLENTSIESPWINVGNTYAVAGDHKTRKDYFAVKGKHGCVAFYRKKWFEINNENKK